MWLFERQATFYTLHCQLMAVTVNIPMTSFIIKLHSRHLKEELFVNVTRSLFHAFLLTATLLYSSGLWAQSFQKKQPLPELGDSTSSLFSLEQEYTLGRAWLMSFRSQVKTISDPLLQDYLEHIIYHLATYSQLKDRRLDMVIVDNPTINAFAVPGGVIGIHTGLLTHAETEAQFATVLSHELAHLSQRHFARGIEQQKRMAIPNMAGLLAGVLLAATAGGDAGVAVLTATQAASLQNRLRYSRSNEQEADRIGMQTMVAADMDPYAASAMFGNMLKASRFSGTRPPEFLLTHPVTEKRIADTRNRAREFPRRVYTDNRYYQLMRVRAELSLIDSNREAVKIFRNKVANNKRASEANQYGLVLALIKDDQLDEAGLLLSPLIKAYPSQIPYVIAASELDMAKGNSSEAIQQVESALALSIGNHPLTMTLAKFQLKTNQAHKAAPLLEEHVKSNGENPEVWYQLAEAHGLAGNIVGVHQARAEFFVLRGVLDKATTQLSYALPLTKGNQLTTLRINERIKQINELKTALKDL
ncbi:MAG: putative Zn-dependent protease [Pseudohongiellaceae bacterium]|jgi:predicted Zn-dependent protease